MDNLEQTIIDELRFRSIILVGPTDSGKTYWVQNTLIPFLESSGQKVEYLKDGDQSLAGTPDVVVCDEVETLFDEEYLQGETPEPYYTNEYLTKVRRWFANYSLLPQKTIFIVTRNESDQIKNLVDNMHQADWDNRDVTVLKFENNSAI